MKRLDAGKTAQRRRRQGPASSVLSRGEPMQWLTGGGLVISVLMIIGLLVLIVWQGAATFWPQPLLRIITNNGDTLMGEVTRRETFTRDGIEQQRMLVRTGNFELTQEHFQWLPESEIMPGNPTRPQWGLVLERLAWGRFYGVPTGFRIDNEIVTEDPGEAWRLFREHHSQVRDRRQAARRLEKKDVGKVNHTLEQARLELKQARLDGEDGASLAGRIRTLDETEARAESEFQALRVRINQLDHENARFAIRLATADGAETFIALSDVVRAYPANQLGVLDKTAVYLARWLEFLRDDPREANSEGGVFPAIFGTVIMTIIMSLLVVPFGVVAALYLREYAKGGLIISLVRISVNNLAGVPSIVFGVFGLGFFCYIVGGNIDQVFFAANLPSPTFGTGGVLWASLTLALLTLPVVIVATEEALAAVPNSMREGSYACGASQWQTIRRIVLPRALPGILTGTILAMARGAGEVAPLMLVGAVKLAPELPVDGLWPFIHPERSFMHLGFHIYDLGFQSQNSEAAKPMVFTTTLLLITIISAMNILAVRLRTRLRRKFISPKF
jgi:phosphate transport system permease protein